MNTDEQAFAGAIRRHLDEGAAGLRPGVAYRLQQARARALGALAPAGETASSGETVGSRGLAGAGGGPDVRTGPASILPRRWWFGVIVAAVAVLAFQQWDASSESEAMEDLDAQILTSELPIDAYLDRGFQQWLKTSAPAN